MPDVPDIVGEAFVARCAAEPFAGREVPEMWDDDSGTLGESSWQDSAETLPARAGCGRI